MNYQVFIIIILQLLTFSHAEFIISDSTLLKVVSVIRHGTRYVETPKLADPEDIKYSGELTPVGMRQQNELGRVFHKIYAEDEKLISLNYEPSEIYVQSTDKNRTIQSAQSFLHGLYQQTATINNKVDQKYFDPPFDSKIIQNITKPDGNSSIGKNIFPIPIRTLPYDQDKYLLTHGNVCSASIKWREQNMQSKEWQEVSNYYQPQIDQLQQKIQEFIKSDLSTPLDINQVYEWMDAILCQKQKGGSNYPQIDDELFQTMQDISQLQFFIIFFLRDYQLKAISSPFYNLLLSHFDYYIENKTDHKLVLFFAHDTTINMILNTLDLTGYDCIKKKLVDKNWDESKICFTNIVKVASNILFELRKNNQDNKLFISIRYNGDYLKFNQGKDTMLFSDFKTKFTDWQIQNWDEVCENINKNEEGSSLQDIPTWCIAVILIIFILFLISSYLACKFQRKLNSSSTEQKHIEFSDNL